MAVDHDRRGRHLVDGDDLLDFHKIAGFGDETIDVSARTGPGALIELVPALDLLGKLGDGRLVGELLEGLERRVHDLLGGQVDFMCDQTSNTISQIQAGKIKVYGVTTKSRVSALPQVPTWTELGVKSVSANWRYVIGPSARSEKVGFRCVMDEKDFERRYGKK